MISRRTASSSLQFRVVQFRVFLHFQNWTSRLTGAMQRLFVVQQKIASRYDFRCASICCTALDGDGPRYTASIWTLHSKHTRPSFDAPCCAVLPSVCVNGPLYWGQNHSVWEKDRFICPFGVLWLVESLNRRPGNISLEKTKDNNTLAQAELISLASLYWTELKV